jgi:hypothetical protein
VQEVVRGLEGIDLLHIDSRLLNVKELQDIRSGGGDVHWSRESLKDKDILSSSHASDVDVLLLTMVRT